MKKIAAIIPAFFLFILSAAQKPAFKNYWDTAPKNIPSNVSIDARSWVMEI